MFRNGGWRLFAAGVLCGMILMALGTALQGWAPRPQRSAQDDAIYDNCLMRMTGNKVACDALMRTLERERIVEAAMLQEAAKMRAAGVSKREIVKWASDRGFVGKQLSDAAGISLEELQSDKY